MRRSRSTRWAPARARCPCVGGGRVLGGPGVTDIFLGFVLGRQTVSGDWFGEGPKIREGGFDFCLEWGQFSGVEVESG